MKVSRIDNARLKRGARREAITPAPEAATPAPAVERSENEQIRLAVTRLKKLGLTEGQAHAEAAKLAAMAKIRFALEEALGETNAQLSAIASSVKAIDLRLLTIEQTIRAR